MNWVNSRKSSWTCFAGIAFVVMVLFSMASCSALTSTKAPTDTPMPTTAIVPVRTDTPTIASVPTTPHNPAPAYPAPTLVNPAPGATIIGENLTTFSWEWDGDLQEQEGENFDLRIWRSEKPYCTVDILHECSYLLDAPPDGFGQYQWQVAVVRMDESGKSTLSESLVWPFVWNAVLPTATPTATPSPTPKPDAVVKAEALNLRSGPGVVYDILEILKRGDPLKIRGKCPDGNWLKVTCPSGLEGWVAAWLVQINLPLTKVAFTQVPTTPTPMYTPTPTATPTPELLPPPIPLEPENGASFIGGPVILKWRWDRPREEDEVFSVRVHRDGEAKPCHHAQARDLEYWGDLTYCTEGKHYWSVALARRLCSDEADARCWQNLSKPSEERWIHYVPGEEPWTWPTPGKPGPEPSKEPPKEPPG